MPIACKLDVGLCIPHTTHLWLAATAQSERDRRLLPYGKRNMQHISYAWKIPDINPGLRDLQSKGRGYARNAQLFLMITLPTALAQDCSVSGPSSPSCCMRSLLRYRSSVKWHLCVADEKQACYLSNRATSTQAYLEYKADWKQNLNYKDVQRCWIISRLHWDRHPVSGTSGLPGASGKASNKVWRQQLFPIACP